MTYRRTAYAVMHEGTYLHGLLQLLLRPQGVTSKEAKAAGVLGSSGLRSGYAYRHRFGWMLEQIRDLYGYNWRSFGGEHRRDECRVYRVTCRYNFDGTVAEDYVKEIVNA